MSQPTMGATTAIVVSGYSGAVSFALLVVAFAIQF
jgi:hypothetical protein